jgi:hypothetical protein
VLSGESTGSSAMKKTRTAWSNNSKYLKDGLYAWE